MCACLCVHVCACVIDPAPLHAQGERSDQFSQTLNHYICSSVLPLLSCCTALFRAIQSHLPVLLGFVACCIQLYTSVQLSSAQLDNIATFLIAFSRCGRLSGPVLCIAFACLVLCGRCMHGTLIAWDTINLKVAWDIYEVNKLIKLLGKLIKQPIFPRPLHRELHPRALQRYIPKIIPNLSSVDLPSTVHWKVSFHTATAHYTHMSHTLTAPHRPLHSLRPLLSEWSTGQELSRSR